MHNRDYKQFAPGEYYHVYNRGNAKANIFLDDADYRLFLNRLSEALYPDQPVKGALSHGRNQRRPMPANAFSLVAYCLMPNHYHLLIGQKTDMPISTLMLKVCTSYSKLFNKRYERVGSLFQDQFKAVRIESNEQLLHLSAYIHLNPVTARLVGRAEQYAHSSYAEYLGDQEGICDRALLLSQFAHPSEYKAFVDTTALRDKTAYVKGALSHGLQWDL